MTPDLKELANLDIRDEATDQEREVLRRHKNEWREILLEMKRNSDFQLASSRAESAEKRLILSETAFEQYEATRLRWKANNIRFKNGIENRLGYIRSLDNEDLRQAIITHRDSVLNCNDDFTDKFDEALWNTVK